jgi:hypothetical protein
MKWIAHATRSTVGRFTVAISPRRTVGDIEIVDARENAEERPVFEKVEAALQLIADHDPNRRARIGRDLRRVVVMSHTGPEYWPELRACILSERVVEKDSELGVATAVVHEATHARLWRLGIRYSSSIRGRVEALCTRAELAFLRRVPGTEHFQEKLQRRRAQWWTDEALTDRYTSRLEEAGAPRWLIWIFGKLRRLRHTQ